MNQLVKKPRPDDVRRTIMKLSQELPGCYATQPDCRTMQLVANFQYGTGFITADETYGYVGIWASSPWNQKTIWTFDLVTFEIREKERILQSDYVDAYKLLPEPGQIEAHMRHVVMGCMFAVLEGKAGYYTEQCDTCPQQLTCLTTRDLSAMQERPNG